MKITDDDRCAISFEDEAARVEHEICSVPGLLCVCCAGGGAKRCGACLHATSFHCCEHTGRRKVWCKGTLYGGVADYQRILLNLYPREVGNRLSHPIRKRLTSIYCEPLGIAKASRRRL